ncbi:MAG: hypothetical protein KIH80_002315 [Flavobacteriia bacterium]|nr:hypothetical protein [Flavobacteriia bacterium]
MKNSFYLFLAVFVILGCQNENYIDESVLSENLSFDQAQLNASDGVLTYEDHSYIPQKNGVISKFTAHTFNYNYHIEYDFNYRITYHPEASELIIENKNADESITLKNLVFKNKTISFDAFTNQSQVYKGVRYQTNMTDLNSNPQFWWLVQPVIEFVIDMVNDDKKNQADYDDNCKLAIAACGAYGVDYINLIRGNWFSQDSCTVKCKE